MLRMLVVLAGCEAFEVVQDFKITEHHTQSILLNKVHKSTTIFLLPEGVRLEHPLCFPVITQFWIEVIP